MFFNVFKTSPFKLSSALTFSINLINSCTAQSVNTVFSEFTMKKILKLKWNKKKIIIRSGKKKKRMKQHVCFGSTVNMYSSVYEKDAMRKYTGAPADRTAVKVWSNSHNLIYKEIKSSAFSYHTRCFQNRVP